MENYVNKHDFDAMKQRVDSLEKAYSQQSQLLGDISILINGSEKLGVDGLHARQKKDDAFREDVRRNFHRMSRVIEENGDQIMENVNLKLAPVVVNVTDLLEWRKQFNDTLKLLTGSTTWRIIFFISLLLIGIGVFVKLKLLNYFMPK